MFPLAQHEWWFCEEPDCDEPDRIDDIQGRLWACAWLQQFKGDPLRMRLLRDFATSHITLPPSQVSDEALVQQVADLLISGALHLHEEEVKVHLVGGAGGTDEKPAFPLSERQSRDSGPPPPALDPPSFPSNTNLSSQAATLVAAAAQGAPFCPQ